LYNGNVYIYNYKTQNLVKSFEVTDLPGMNSSCNNYQPCLPTFLFNVNNSVRTCKFVPRKQWVITGADDMFIRVYNYNTMEKVTTFEAHQDYIRYFVPKIGKQGKVLRHTT
jgi:coatomer subunit beta'